MVTPQVLRTPAIPNEIAFKGGVGKFCAITALVLNVLGIAVGCYLVAYSDRPMVVLVALVVLIVSMVLGLTTLATHPHYWQGNGTYRKALFAVHVFIGEDGRLYRDDNPAKPRPHWTDARLPAGVTSFGLTFAGTLMLAYAWGWFGL